MNQLQRKALGFALAGLFTPVALAAPNPENTLSADSRRPEHRQGSYARQALLDGLSFLADGKGNPFHYGFIGDTDTHNASATHEEFNYSGKFAFENNPKHRLFGIPGQPDAQKQQVREFSSGGIAGVWAEENTREAIYAAMLRRETFGTSGPMIKLRFFGGAALKSVDATALGVDIPGGLAETIQERAYSSPIWYSPTR